MVDVMGVMTQDTNPTEGTMDLSTTAVEAHGLRERLEAYTRPRPQVGPAELRRRLGAQRSYIEGARMLVARIKRARS